MSSKIIVWFSCGAASAVAAKLALNTYRNTHNVEVCYCDLSHDEHPDNARFLSDVEKWIGQSVIRLSHPKYKSVADVVISQQYIVGVAGAPCTKLLKREVRKRYQKPDDIHVFGFTSDEQDRIDQFETNNPDMAAVWPLRDARIAKSDCYKILQAVGIELPAMYQLGFANNNCIGCVKGGAGYWNKIRIHFPERFRERAELERVIGASILRRTDGSKLFLDELDPMAGRDVPEPDIECGIMCGMYANLVNEAGAAS